MSALRKTMEYLGLSDVDTHAPRASEQYVEESGDADFDQSISVYYDVLSAPRSTGPSPVGEQVKQALLDAVTAALNGEKEPAQALGDAQASAQREFDSAS